jgi:glycosyltransferase involved in cell wall biosynthesis
MKHYDIVYVISIASTTTGGTRFFIQLASEMAKHFKVALITGKTTTEARRLLAGVDLYDGKVYNGCDILYSCPMATARFFIYTLKVLTAIKFDILHTDNHIPNFLAYFWPKKTLITLHHLEVRGLNPIIDIVQFLELKAPRLALYSPLKLSKDTVRIPPILRFSPLNIKSNKKVEKGLVVMVGRLESRKNYPMALAAFAVARRFRPELRLVIVGDGPEKKNLIELAKRLGVAEAVEIRSNISDEEKYELLSAAEVFIHLGKPEGFSLAVFEALSFGLPVVAHREVPVVSLFRFPNVVLVDLSVLDIATYLVNPPPRGRPLQVELDLASFYLKLYLVLKQYVSWMPRRNKNNAKRKTVKP